MDGQFFYDYWEFVYDLYYVEDQFFEGFVFMCV